MYVTLEKSYIFSLCPSIFFYFCFALRTAEQKKFIFIGLDNVKFVSILLGLWVITTVEKTIEETDRTYFSFQII